MPGQYRGDGRPRAVLTYFDTTNLPPVDTDGIVLRAAGSTAFVVTGIVADVSAVALLALSDDVRRAASDNPLAMLLICGGLALTTLTILNVYSRALTRVRKGQAQIESLQKKLERADPSDIARWDEFWHDFGRDSPLYRWLSQGFLTTSANEREVDELDRVDRKWARDPARYYDADVARAFELLRDALSSLQDVTVHNYWAERDAAAVIGRRTFLIPPEWDHTRRSEAILKIDKAWDAVMAAHENFVSVCYMKKLARSRYATTEQSDQSQDLQNDRSEVDSQQ